MLICLDTVHAARMNDHRHVLRQPGHAALRRGRCSISGQTYLLTTTTAKRVPWLSRWRVACAVAREIGGNRLWRDNTLHAWVLMPDHMHLLVSLGPSESLPQLVARVKSVGARAARVVAPDTQPFWANAFHDHALRRDEQIETVARYIVANPVRAGLVDSPWAWPFWNSEWLP